MHPHLKRLVIERHLSPAQGDFIHRNWGDSPGDLWAQPQVRALNEHTRGYIDQLRGHLGVDLADDIRRADGQERER